MHTFLTMIIEESVCFMLCEPIFFLQLFLCVTHGIYNLSEKVQILGHVHIICITVREGRIICCQIFCDLLLKSAFERIFNVMQLILVKIKWHLSENIESKNSTIFAFHITLKKKINRHDQKVLNHYRKTQKIVMGMIRPQQVDQDLLLKQLCCKEFNSKTITNGGNLLEYYLKSLLQSLQGKKHIKHVKICWKMQCVYFPNMPNFRIWTLFRPLSQIKIFFFFIFFMANE
jgi:hypothetical protein